MCASLLIQPRSRSRGMSISLAAQQALRKIRYGRAAAAAATASAGTGTNNTGAEFVDGEAETYKSYRPESVEHLCRSTKFTKHEIQVMYRSFKQECPGGLLDLQKLTQIYSKFFPHGDPSSYTKHLFHSIDQSNSGQITFEEFVRWVSVISRGSSLDKLSWSFRLYDVNRDKKITRDDMFTIVDAVYQLGGTPDDATSTSSGDRRDLVALHVEWLFRKMDGDCDGAIYMPDFILACRKDERMMASLLRLNTIIYS